MIKLRCNEPFQMVLISDPALDAVPLDRMKKYEETRDISVLKLDEISEKPTILHARPLRPEHEHMLDDGRQDSLWNIFRHHITRIENVDFGGRKIFEPGDHGPVIRDDARDVFPMDAVTEAALVIRLKASRFDSRPFFSLGTWRAERKRRNSQSASNAVTEAASATLSE